MAITRAVGTMASDAHRCELGEQMMAGDADWVEDVRRWCMAGREVEGGYVTGSRPEPVSDSNDAIGYEAALPTLQSRHWPDAPSSKTATQR